MLSFSPLFFTTLIIIISISNISSYKDGEIVETVSPPFLQVAQDLYSNQEISYLLKDPDHYDPWGKTGVAYSIIYYVRNARLAVQWHSNPADLMIEDQTYDQIWSHLFKLEMDIFTAFKHWFDNKADKEKWRSFVRITYSIISHKFKYYLDNFAKLESFISAMPIYEEHGSGSKFASLVANSEIPFDVDFNAKDPYIPSLDDNFPLIGFGSWPLTGDECKAAVLMALKTGYRLIDTSENYHNAKVIGEAVRESGIDRRDVVLASKLSFDRNYGEGVTSEAFYKELDNLGTDYIDLYMLHGPIPDKKRLREAWFELETLYKGGKIKYLGVSNFSPNDLNELISFARIKPMFVQNKFDPFTQGQQTPWTTSIEQWVINYNENIRKKDEDIIVIQAYCVLNSWPHQIRAVDDKHVAWIASQYHVTSAQLLIRWVLQHKYIGVLTRSSKEDRQLENLNVFDFEINVVDMQLLNGLNTLFSPFDIDWMHDVYGQVSNRPQVIPARQEL